MAQGGQLKTKTTLLIYLPIKAFVDPESARGTEDRQVVPAQQPCTKTTSKILTAEYDLSARSAEFLMRYPGLRGQYNLELLGCTPYLASEEKESVRSDYTAIFQAFKWTEFAYTSRLDRLVPESRTPFKDCVTFCWYVYCPFSRHATRMRTLYQNVLFRDSATWYMTNKQAMLRRFLLFEQTRRDAVNAGLYTAGEYDVSCASFIPPTFIYSQGREAAVSEAMDPDGTYIVKPATGLQGRGIELHHRSGGGPDFGAFMRHSYGELGVSSSFHLVQRYVERPMLLQGRKFDLRVYLLVVPNMSCCLGCDSNAARRGFYAFYHPGFARLSCLEYGDGSNTDRRVHLTNCSVQEGSADSRPVDGTNWTPDQVNEYFNTRFEAGLDGIPCKDWFKTTVQADLQGILAYVTTHFSRLLVTDTNNAFKLLGCDFLLDAAGRPWLLEMNSLPSLRVASECQKVVKTPMQREALALAIEVAHRSANGQPVTSRCLVMRQNFRLVHSATNHRIQGGLVRTFSDRLRVRMPDLVDKS